MTDLAKRLSGSHDLAAKPTRVFQTRAKLAQERFNERVHTAYKDNIAGLMSKPLSPQEVRAGGRRPRVVAAK
jgi:hypothetical protein